jgi:ABC-type sugar transport system ATPase subunit
VAGEVNESADAPLVVTRGLKKAFGGVIALDGVSLGIARGSIHGLVGENGAGKSTLGRILAGIHAPDDGVILMDGRPVRFRSPREAMRAGIGVVHQELSFCPELSVAENLCLGRWPGRSRRWVDRRAMAARARELLGRVGADLDVQRPMRECSTGEEQLCQVAAALGLGARLLIFDEPTSVLSEAEAENLQRLIAGLRAVSQGSGFLSWREDSPKHIAGPWIGAIRLH